MQEKYELEINSLSVSLTKPPMQFGIPMVAFYGSILASFFGWMLLQTISGSTGITIGIWFLLLWLIMYASMFLISINDSFGLSLAWLNFFNFRQHQTFRVWGNTDSYSL